MLINIKYPRILSSDSVERKAQEYLGRRTKQDIKSGRIERFFQRMADRMWIGSFQYGAGNPRELYLRRLIMELDAYNASGNKEHLINIANYALLEFYYSQRTLVGLPTNYDPIIDSVTRGK